jgi:type II secretory pathway pseudopilin PulG
MIELMVVIGLIAFIYSVAVPQFNKRSGTEVATKTQRLADDIRSAFDMAVLSNKTHRISFHLATGRYHLESAEGHVMLDAENLGRDPSDEEEKVKEEEFNAQTKEYESLAGDPIKDDDGKEIDGSNLSPILKHRDSAAPIKWSKVENLEWNDRSLGDFLLFSEIQAEHHSQVQTLADLGSAGRAFLYFYPQGYVERAFIRIAYKLDDGVVDESERPYTIVTRPFLGTASVNSEDIAINFEDDAGEGDE